MLSKTCTDFAPRCAGCTVQNMGGAADGVDSCWSQPRPSAVARVWRSQTVLLPSCGPGTAQEGVGHLRASAWCAGQEDADPYWSRPWPSAVALAAELLRRPELVAERRAVEVGAGLGVAAIAAALAGAPHTSADRRLC